MVRYPPLGLFAPRIITAVTKITYSRVAIPSALQVGAGTIKTFRSRKDADRFLRETSRNGDDPYSIGCIEQFQEET